MSDEVISLSIINLDDLDREASYAAVQLNKANSRNAILDKALKAIKPGLADLEKVRKDAQKEPNWQADKLVEELRGNYDSSVSESVRTERTVVDDAIKALEKEVTEIENTLNGYRVDVAQAQKALDASTAQFDKSQKDLQGLSKQIQERQKALVALQTEVRDADSKNQLVEAVVKLRDLEEMLSEFRKMIQEKYEDDLWTKLNEDARDLIKKTEAHLDAQAKVSKAENDFNKAKAKYAETQKTRLDLIKKNAADVKTKEQSDGTSKGTAN